MSKIVIKNILDFFRTAYDKKFLADLDILDPSTAKKDSLVVHSQIEKEIGINNKSFSQKAGFTLTVDKKKLKRLIRNCDDPEIVHRYLAMKLSRSRLWGKMKYIMFPEFNQNGGLHYHGIIWDQYESAVIRALNMWRRDVGFVKPELKIRDIDNWTKYIQKDKYINGLWTISNW